MILESSGWKAALLPGRGVAFAGLTLDGQDVLKPIPDGADPNNGFHGAFLMAPWTNRLEDGRIRVGGIDYHMPINRPAERNALHGFFRDLAWTPEDVAADRATFVCMLDHTPFRCTARLTVALSPAGFSLAVSLTNTGDAVTPMGFGWHPWFARRPGTRLSFAATTIFDRDARNIATEPRPGSGLDGGDGLLEGHDTHFAGWDGMAEITRPDGMRLALRADGAWSRNLQIFAPAGGDVLCVEPVTHAPDAANRPDNAAHGAMHPLPPGGMLGASLMIHRL